MVDINRVIDLHTKETGVLSIKPSFDVKNRTDLGKLTHQALLSYLR